MESPDAIANKSKEGAAGWEGFERFYAQHLLNRR